MENQNANTQKIELIEGDLSPKEINEVLTIVVDNLINFYKVNYIRNWERNHTLDPCEKDEKISNLLQHKKKINEICMEAIGNERKVDLDSMFSISLHN